MLKHRNIENSLISIRKYFSNNISPYYYCSLPQLTYEIISIYSELDNIFLDLIIEDVKALTLNKKIINGIYTLSPLRGSLISNRNYFNTNAFTHIVI